MGFEKHYKYNFFYQDFFLLAPSHGFKRGSTLSIEESFDWHMMQVRRESDTICCFNQFCHPTPPHTLHPTCKVSLKNQADTVAN